MKNVINKFLIVGLIACVSYEGCKSQNKSSGNNQDIEDAKWYYYAYTANLDAYSSSTGLTSLNPLSCDIKLDTIISQSKDTTQIFFSMYYQNEKNECTLKPLGLAGVLVIKDHFFVPMYHMITFDQQNEKIITGMMKSQSDLLKKNIQLKQKDVVPWLLSEAEQH